jgi:hypothetical protein
LGQKTAALWGICMLRDDPDDDNGTDDDTDTDDDV